MLKEKEKYVGNTVRDEKKRKGIRISFVSLIFILSMDGDLLSPIQTQNFRINSLSILRAVVCPAGAVRVTAIVMAWYHTRPSVSQAPRGHGIVPPGIVRIAPHDARDGEDQPHKKAAFLKGLQCILRAAWHEAAAGFSLEGR